MRKILLISSAMLALAACGDTPKTATDTKPAAQATATADVNAELSQWFEAKFMEEVRHYPEWLAFLGIQERTDEWNNPSRDFALERLADTRQNIMDLKSSFNRDDLSAPMQLSYDLYIKDAEDTLAGDKWHLYRYPFNQMGGRQSGIPTFLLNQHKIGNEADARAYIARLNGIQDYLGQIVDNARASAEAGITPPKYVHAHVLRDIDNVLSGTPLDAESNRVNLLMKDFQTKVEKLGLSAEAQDALLDDAAMALVTSVRPAYESLAEFIKAQQAVATTDDGVWKHPNGADFYQYRLEMMTTTDMTADEIHDLGLSEVARIHGEMRDIMASVGFEGDLQAFFTYLKTDPKFVYEDSDAGRDAYLAEATRLIDVMETRLDEVFIKKPKAALEVRRVEAFREKSAGKAFYSRPAPDGSRPGYYYANLYRITDMPKYQMEALAYHEGIPGHHMQLAIAQELEGIPKFQRYGRVTAYTEGWGLYSEFLPKEMGFYEDPYSDFGRLAMELWRAARLVVDTGLHDKKWTREEAIDYLLENTPNPEGDCIKAIERYIVMPGQATAYKIGMNKIIDLRENAKAELGDKFDIRKFHDVVIASGPLPLDVLEAQVSRWVESEK